MTNAIAPRTSGITGQIPGDMQPNVVAAAPLALPVAKGAVALGIVAIGVTGYLMGNPKAIPDMVRDLGALYDWSAQQLESATKHLTELLRSGQKNAEKIVSSLLKYMQSLGEAAPPLTPGQSRDLPPTRRTPSTKHPGATPQQKVVPQTPPPRPHADTRTAAERQLNGSVERQLQQQDNAKLLRTDMQKSIAQPIQSGDDLVRNWNALSLWYRFNALGSDRPDLPAGVSLTSILKSGWKELLERRGDSIAAAIINLKPADPKLSGKVRDIKSQIQEFQTFVASKSLPKDLQQLSTAELKGLRDRLHRAQAGGAAQGSGADETSQPRMPPGTSEATTPPGPGGPNGPTGPKGPTGKGSGDPTPKKVGDWTKDAANIVEGTSTVFTALGLEYMGAKALLGEVRVFGDSVPMANGQKLDMPKLVNEFSDTNSLGPQGTLTLATVKPGTNEADGHAFIVLNASTLGSKAFKLDDIKQDLLDPKKGPGHVVSHLLDYVDWDKINLIAQTLPDKGRTGGGARVTLGGLGNITATVVTGTPEFGGLQKFGIQLGMANGTVRGMSANTSVTTLNKKTGNMETVNSGNLLGQAYVNVYGSDARDPQTVVSLQSGLRFGPSSLYVVRVKPTKFEANAWVSTEADPQHGRLSIDLSKLNPKDTRALTLAFNGNKYTELFDKVKANPALVKWDRVGEMLAGKVGVESVVDPSLLTNYGGDALRDVLVLGRDFFDAQGRVIQKGISGLTRPRESTP